MHGFIIRLYYDECFILFFLSSSTSSFTHFIHLTCASLVARQIALIFTFPLCKYELICIRFYVALLRNVLLSLLLSLCFHAQYTYFIHFRVFGHRVLWMFDFDTWLCGATVCEYMCVCLYVLCTFFFVPAFLFTRYE